MGNPPQDMGGMCIGLEVFAVFCAANRIPLGVGG
jgi:hypothetical protein